MKSREMDNNLQPLRTEDIHHLNDVFKVVHRNFLWYISIYIFLLIILVGDITCGIYIYPGETKAVFICVLIAVIFLGLIAVTQRYLTMYYSHRKALRHDIQKHVKQVCSGRLSANGMEGNRLIYQVNGQAVKVADKNTLLGWKIKRFDTLTDTEITLHYLPQSQLLLNIQYHETRLNATSETSFLSDEQIRVLAELPKKDRPTKQVLHQGIVTEVMFFVFPIFYFRTNYIPHRFTFTQWNIRLGNQLLTQVSKGIQVGEHHKVVEFLK